ncbi:MAG: gas vesicle protein GvpG [Desulfitobacteriaceae bacterium]
MVLGRFIWWVLEEITERAEADWYSPEAIRGELSQLQYLMQNKRVTPEEYRDREKRLFDRLIEGRERGIE